MTYRTQKATGISAIRTMIDTYNPARLVTNQIEPKIESVSFIVLASGDDICDAWVSAKVRGGFRNKPVFARPCPTVPRHGFVDSRRVESVDDLRAVWNETVAADALGEVVLMPEIDAAWNIVATPASLVIGPGHDGATAGRGSVEYQIKSVVPNAAKQAARIGADDDPYFEAVIERETNRILLTQMRGGPKVEAGGDFIPQPIFVTNLIEIDPANPPDALKWETKMATLSASVKAETVVWHPGGSRLSHYSAHAILNGVAVVYGKRPEVCRVLEPTAAVEEYDADAVSAGLLRGLATDLGGFIRSDYSDSRTHLLAFAACGIHNATTLRTGASADLLGGAMAVLYRLAAAACIGEYRHKGKSSGLSKDRSQVYSDVLRSMSEQNRLKLRKAAVAFASQSWANGFGGSAWAICAQHTIDLEELIYRYLRGEVEIEKLIGVAHRLLNAVHNGGAMLNKFGDKQLLDAAAEGDLGVSLAAITAWATRICADSRAIAVTARSVYIAPRVVCKARKFWNTERGAFIEAEEVIEAAMEKKRKRSRKSKPGQEPSDAQQEAAAAPVARAQFRFTATNYLASQIHVQAAWHYPKLAAKPAAKPLKPILVPKNIYGTNRLTGDNTPQSKGVSYSKIDLVFRYPDDEAVIEALRAATLRSCSEGGTELKSMASDSARPYTPLVAIVGDEVDGGRRSVALYVDADNGERVYVGSLWMPVQLAQAVVQGLAS